MRNALILFLSILITTQVMAQAPLGFNYQGIARQSDGTPISQQDVGIKVSIIDGPQGTAQFVEEHFLTTNDFGLFTAIVGQGSGNSSLNSIDWAAGNLWIQIELDPNNSGNYILMGSQQLMSVPYALFAQESGEGLKQGYGVDINNGTISNVLPDRPITLTGIGNVEVSGAYPNFAIETISSDDADADPTNEFQTISKVGSTVTLSDGGNSFIDEVNDADSDITNEIQTLSLATNNLDLTSGGSVDLSGYLDNTDNQTLAQVLSEGASAGNTKISDLAEPTNAQDAASKNYVDTQDTGLQSSISAEVANRTNADASIQSELDETQTGAGLNADGTYSADVTTNYIFAAASLKNADKILDLEINGNANDIETLVTRLDNTYAFSTDYSFTNTTATVYTNEVVDINSIINFDNFSQIDISNKIIIQESGIYNIQVLGTSNFTNSMQVSVRVNGITIHQVLKQNKSLSAQFNDIGLFLLSLNIGDYVELIVESSDALGDTISGTLFGYKL